MVNNPELINKMINNINKLDDEIIKEAIQEVESEDMEEDIKILKKMREESINAAANACTGAMSNIWRKEAQAIENLLKRYKELEEENKYLSEQNMMMSGRHFNDSQKIKELNKAITYMLQDLEVEKKGFTIEEMKDSYLLRAKSKGIFIK